MSHDKSIHTTDSVMSVQPDAAVASLCSEVDYAVADEATTDGAHSKRREQQL